MRGRKMGKFPNHALAFTRNLGGNAAEYTDRGRIRRDKFNFYCSSSPMTLGFLSEHTSVWLNEGAP